MTTTSFQPDSTTEHRHARPRPSAEAAVYLDWLDNTFDRCGADAYRLAHALLLDCEDAEQAVVNAFVTLFDRASSFGAWPSNERDGLVSEVYRHSALIRSSSTAEAAVRPGENDSPAGRATSLWASLPSLTRDAFALALFGRCQCIKIAELVGVPVDEVRCRLNVALAYMTVGPADFVVPA